MNSQLLGSTALLLASTLPCQWVETTPATSPAGRAGHGMCFDPITSTTLVFGGDTLGFPVGPTNDTWRHDGNTWTQLTPTTSPPAAAGVEMVFDANRGVFVTYGSLSTSFFGGPSDDRTWEFDGTDWTEVFPVNTPGGLGLYGMSYDLARGVTVLYGGLPDSFFPLDTNQTWEYDGLTWTERTPANNPGPLERPGMCYHAAGAVTVLFGGIDVQSGGNDDTWLYDGNDWSVAAVTGPRPSVRTGCKLAYDTDRNVCVMTGGQDPTNGTPFDDTWEFDLNALTWTQIASTYTGARLDAGLSYDPGRKVFVQFGGANFQTFTAYGDTWEHGARNDVLGVGCAGSNGVPVLGSADAPRFGVGYALQVDNLEASVSTAVFVLSATEIPPAPLDIIGMPGCTAYVSPDVLLTATGAAGSAGLTVPMPTSPALIGATLVSQALGFDPGLNALSLSASNGLKGTLGS